MKIYDSKEYLKEQLKTKTYLAIAKEQEVGKSTIQRKLKQFKLTKPTKPWSKKEIQGLKENYDAREGIQKFFSNRTKTAVYRKAFKLGLHRPLRRRYRKVNEDFFKKWTKESGYVLGWLFSDGNVSRDLRTFGFHINKKDIEILKKIKNVLKSQHKISVYGNYIEFRVHSKKMCKDLVALGCMPKKALKIRFPKKMPKKYASHFVGGYFDGDGSIHFNYPNVIKISIVGNRKFIDCLGKEIAKMLKIEKPKIRKLPSGTWRIGFYGNNARKFCKWIYKGRPNLYLDRKYQRFKNHLNKRRRT